MRYSCQMALIRVMNAALTYYHFWLPGLMHNFLFKVLEVFWASLIKDSFKIILISFFNIYIFAPASSVLPSWWEWRLQWAKGIKGSVSEFPAGDLLWLSVLVHSCFIKVKSVRDIYISTTLGV